MPNHNTSLYNNLCGLTSLEVFHAWILQVLLSDSKQTSNYWSFVTLGNYLIVVLEVYL